jgi:hypothetical protein
MVDLVTIAAVDVVVVIPIEIVVVVNVHVAVAPIAIAPVAARPRAECEASGAPSQTHSGIPARITVRVVGISGRTIDHHRII